MIGYFLKRRRKRTGRDRRMKTKVALKVVHSLVFLVVCRRHVNLNESHYLLYDNYWSCNVIVQKEKHRNITFLFFLFLRIIKSMSLKKISQII